MSYYQSSSSVSGCHPYDGRKEDERLDIARASEMSANLAPSTSRKRPAPCDDDQNEQPQYQLLGSSGAVPSTSSLHPLTGFSYDDRFSMPYGKQNQFGHTGSSYTTLSAPPPPIQKQEQKSQMLTSQNDFHIDWGHAFSDYFIAPPESDSTTLHNNNYQYRPDAAITPPMTGEHQNLQNFHAFTTPADSGAALVTSSLMYTPPEENGGLMQMQSQNLPSSSNTYYTCPPSKAPQLRMITPVASSSSECTTSDSIKRTHKQEAKSRVVAVPRAAILRIHPVSRTAHSLIKHLILPVGDVYGNADIQMLTLSRDHIMGDGDVEVRQVDGRLPSVGSRSKYTLTVGELRRRTSQPEYMNKSSMYGFFRKSKKKSECNAVRDVLSAHNVKIQENQRSRKQTRFTPMLEQECLHLADDLRALFDRNMPFDPIAKNMVLDMMMREGVPAETCVERLRSTVKVMERIIATLSLRQPIVTGLQPALKNNRLDITYHIFSLLTHGFGHPCSLVHYKNYLKLVQQAIKYAEMLLMGFPLESDHLHPNESPFKVWGPGCMLN